MAAYQLAVGALLKKLPVVNDDGSTAVPGLYIVGDLTGIPLLKLSSDSGARAIQTIAKDSNFIKRSTSNSEVVDVAIIGAGVSGMAAALEARKQGLNYKLIEASQAFNTVVNFPQRKPIFTYPSDMTPAGDLQFSDQADIRESLLKELRARTIEQGIEVFPAKVDQVNRKGSLLELVIPGEDSIPGASRGWWPLAGRETIAD